MKRPVKDPVDGVLASIERVPSLERLVLRNVREHHKLDDDYDLVALSNLIVESVSRHSTRWPQLHVLALGYTSWYERESPSLNWAVVHKTKERCVEDFLPFDSRIVPLR